LIKPLLGNASAASKGLRSKFMILIKIPDDVALELAPLDFEPQQIAELRRTER
jgi:hypothetical protein